MQQSDISSAKSSPDVELQSVEASPDVMPQLLENVGSLSISSSGHVRFEPNSSQLGSDVANATAKEYIDELSESSQGELSGFPFSWKPPVNRSELLAYLPPRQYSDSLKDTYFRVFSPVSSIPRTLGDLLFLYLLRCSCFMFFMIPLLKRSTFVSRKMAIPYHYLG